MQEERTSTTTGASIKDAETRIQRLGQMLLDARPESIERCQSELQQIVALLERLVSEGVHPSSPIASAALLRIRRSARLLKLQAEYASNLCLGWIQLRLGAGYTAQGAPLLVQSEAGRTFEA
jgi:hypothetical protein